ncbi:MAG: peptidase T [Cytophagales bacterium]|nr:peptidase T [Cytophagales bacterium]
MTHLPQLISTYSFSSKDRFLTYVKIDTQSDPKSTTSPSTEKQKDLALLIVKELHDLGISNAHTNEYGYVYAHLESNVSDEIPAICFCAHMDTSPDCSGLGVKPIIHQNYQGKDIVLPDDPSVIIRLNEHPDLQEQFGNDIITASGTTLLGADNKAGVAEIMDAVAFWQQYPSVKHGPISIVFTPDEEVGRGTDHIDIQKINAVYGYTLDGEKKGHLENETFSADGFTIKIKGISQHPGFAKGRMESAIKIAAEIISNLPKEYLSPETTEKMEGFIHPVDIQGHVEEAQIDFILRDFDTLKLIEYGNLLKEITSNVLKNYPNSTADFIQTEQYRNMNEILKDHPLCISLAMNAMKLAGLTPETTSIRGGTDGSRLTFMGLPCPNIFAGEHAFHSKEEWVSVQDMQKATETILYLAELYTVIGIR